MRAQVWIQLGEKLITASQREVDVRSDKHVRDVKRRVRRMPDEGLKSDGFLHMVSMRVLD